MINKLFRLSLLLFVLSLVTFIGLNRSLIPQNITRIQAHVIAIVLTGTGPANAIGFGADINCDSDNLAPGDSCLAVLSVKNTSEARITITAPTLNQITGALTTCGGGGWLTGDIGNLSYVPDTTILNIGDTQTFEFNIDFSIDAPNECQNQPADFLISVSANCIDGDEDCGAENTPTPTRTPTRTPTATSTPARITTVTLTPTAGTPGLSLTTDFGGTAVPAGTPTLISETLGSTVISETLPSRFPVTGQGSSLSDDLTSLAELMLIGTGLLTIGLLLATLGFFGQRKRDQE